MNLPHKTGGSLTSDKANSYWAVELTQVSTTLKRNGDTAVNYAPGAVFLNSEIVRLNLHRKREREAVRRFAAALNEMVDAVEEEINVW